MSIAVDASKLLFTAGFTVQRWSHLHCGSIHTPVSQCTWRIDWDQLVNAHARFLCKIIRPFHLHLSNIAVCLLQNLYENLVYRVLISCKLNRNTR